MNLYHLLSKLYKGFTFKARYFCVIIEGLTIYMNNRPNQIETPNEVVSVPPILSTLPDPGVDIRIDQVLESPYNTERVNFNKCQLWALVQDYINGESVEFETLGPYLSDYNTATGEVWPDNLVPDDEIGIQIAQILRRFLPNARLISLYDEYNSSLPDSAHEVRGIPIEATPMLAFPEETKAAFKQSLIDLFKQRGLITNNASEGQEFLMVSESSKSKDAETLVQKLRDAGHIEDGSDGTIFFINELAENPHLKRIKLKNESGKWYCPALDAASYMNPENHDITHLVVLPKYFEKQQDQVWEMLRVLNIKPTKYHNIFFDPESEPEQIAADIESALSQEFNKHVNTIAA